MTWPASSRRATSWAVTGRDDPIFPIAHTEAAFAQLAKVYQALWVPERCELYVGAGGHRYYKDRVWSFVAEAFTERPAKAQRSNGPYPRPANRAS